MNEEKVDFKQEAKEISDYFSRVTNNFSFHYQELAEELKDSKEMRQLAFHWLTILRSENYRTDGRNEKAKMRGQELAEVPFIKKKLENLKEDVKLIKVAVELSHDHRTLQQTFSKFVFYYILITCTEKQQKELKEKLGENFYRLPLI